MKLLRGASSNPHFTAGTVATIGNFDGVHLGHQALLHQLKAEALQRGLPAVVVLFEPQPSEFFRRHEAPSRLSSLREKLSILKQCKIDYVYCLQFNQTLAAMNPGDFIEKYFFSLLNVHYLLIGEDFRFGRQRQGDVKLLTTIGADRHCLVQTFSDFNLNGLRVSSTKIRELLAQGQLAAASTLLGRPFSLCGRVSIGDGRGRQWGIPTANLKMHRLSLPLKGVYCVQVLRKNGQIHKGVANLGSRPTVDGSKNVLEVHLFDFDESLYGDILQVFFLHKLRDEIKFSSVNELISQIHTDVAMAKSTFDTGCLELNVIQSRH